jgi:hypothetical protein
MQEEGNDLGISPLKMYVAEESIKKMETSIKYLK